jgi:sn-glycerol 3-phosphate transport system permease protein
MVERNGLLTLLTHGVLICGVALVGFPLYLALVASSHSPQELAQAPIPMWFGDQLWQSYSAAITGTGGASAQGAAARMLWVSFVVAMAITVGKISVSLLSAFALVFFRFPLRRLCFWAIFITLMLPVEVRIGPTYQVTADLHMVNSFAGLAVPLIASATATFLFRQFFLTVPDELVEAARMDGAGPLRFFWDILLPLSGTSIAALFVIQFIYGWNQYLWPLIVATNENMYPVTVGLRRMFGGADSPPQWNVVMATALLATLPPALVVVLMQKWFVKGLVDGDK